MNLFQIFEHLNANGNSARNKVLPIAGDIAQDGLGISEQDIQKLINEVNVVFHSAATVKFDEPLRTSIEYNVLGTRRVIQLCHKMKNLKVTINAIHFFCSSCSA